MSNNPEDLKLLTLAKATMVRSNARSAAALRDNTGRTYVAIPVKSGNFEIDSLLSVLVVAKASQITGIEAIVIAGEVAPTSSIEIIRAEDSTAKLFSITDADDLIAIE
ncbi:MAG: hypothetical protein ACOYK0_03410 [Candidatus Nanopelagicaceae bacterium]